MSAVAMLVVVLLGTAALAPPVAAEPPDGRGKPDKCEKKKPKPECELSEPPLPYITTIAGGGYTDGKPAIEAPLGFPIDVAADSAGNTYISDSSESRIRKVDRTGIITTVAGNGIAGYRGDGGPATQARLGAPTTLAIGPDGSIYHTDNRYQVVRRVDPNGIITTVAGTGTGGFSGDGGPASEAAFNGPAGLAFGPDGALYVSDAANQRIRRIDSDGIVTTVAGTGENGFAGDGGPALEASFSYPYDIGFGPGGELYVVDGGNRRVRMIAPDGTISTVVGTGDYASTGDGGPAKEANLMWPRNISVDQAGNLFISDIPAQRIRKVDTNGIITTYVGTGSAGFSGDGGPATLAQTKEAHGTTVDAEGNLFLADVGNSRVRRVDTNRIISTIGGNGESWFVGDGETATNAALRRPGGVVEAPDGTLFIADTGNQRIRKVDPVTRVMTTIAGTGELGFSGDGGPAIEAKLADPWDVELDENGNLYVVDYWNNRIRRITPDGIITTVAGTGVPGHTGDKGPATAANMDHPTAIDYADGELFIAVGGSKVIRKVDRNGIITTLAGGGLVSTGQDGLPASLVALKGPTDVIAMPDGTVLFADAFDHRVRRIDFDGAVPTISTVAGTGEAGYGGDGGPATQARFAFPFGLLPLGDGSLLVTDHSNHRIRKIDPKGVVTTVAGDGRDEFEGDGGHPLRASMRGPTNLSVGAAGVFVTDAANDRIRLIRGQL